MQIRVYYEDTDVGGVVYHSNYINYCERARSELFFERGMSPHQDNEYFVAKHLEANFIKPAVFADVLEVATKVIKLKNASAVLLQTITRDGEKLFEMTITVAYLKDKRPAKIPTQIKTFFQQHL
ncbi:MAG: YbgC/FadM family acyl-CoA thioesterase [Campylobacterota bacterium]|nr:YbgC/FadM family acyl-CoA thioesterase [Campylobacterota bacterium]